MKLKELRKQKGLTQAACAKYLNIPLRTYINYENDDSKQKSIKYMYMLDKLQAYGYVDETHGVLNIEQIKEACSEVFSGHDVVYCYLFGSYAKGSATEGSDVDLLIATGLTGLKFYALIEELREALKKKVDVLNQSQIKDNFNLINEILMDGIKIYG